MKLSVKHEVLDFTMQFTPDYSNSRFLNLLSSKTMGEAERVLEDYWRVHLGTVPTGKSVRYLRSVIINFNLVRYSDTIIDINKYHMGLAYLGTAITHVVFAMVIPAKILGDEALRDALCEVGELIDELEKIFGIKIDLNYTFPISYGSFKVSLEEGDGDKKE